MYMKIVCKDMHMFVFVDLEEKYRYFFYRQ